jgi:hypothetical protein
MVPVLPWSPGIADDRGGLKPERPFEAALASTGILAKATAAITAIMHLNRIDFPLSSDTPSVIHLL